MSGDANQGKISIARCREELEQLSALYASGHPDRRGLEAAMGDWILEEVALRRSCKECDVLQVEQKL